jgi:hypothetical protein
MTVPSWHHLYRKGHSLGASGAPVRTEPPAAPESTKYGSATAVDPRIKGYQFQLCEFAGNQFSPDDKRRCRMYHKSGYRDCCMWYNKHIEDIEDTYNANKRTLCICTCKEK